MTTMYFRIPVSLVTIEVGAEVAEEEGAMSPALILMLTLMPSPSSNYSSV